MKASRQQITNLAVHYPPKFGVVETNCCIYKNCRISPEGCIYQTAVSRPEIYRTAVSRPKLPPVRIVRVVPLSLGISLGLSNRYDGQGSMRHHAELWNQRLQNGCTGESIKIQLFNLRSQVVEFALRKKWVPPHQAKQLHISRQIQGWNVDIIKLYKQSWFGKIVRRQSMEKKCARIYNNDRHVVLRIVDPRWAAALHLL